MQTIALNSPMAWIKACRPQTLGATLCPIMIGSAFAKVHGHFSLSYFWLTLVAALLLQILANIVNDYGDFKRGSDTKERLGPPRAMQMAWISKNAMEKGIGLVMLSVVMLGIVLVMRGGVPILLAGSFGFIICCWYTLGPKPLAYLGFVEILIFFIFGPGEVLGAYYVQSLSVTVDAVIMSMSPGFLACALNLTNNVRDMHQDKLHHKRTIAVRCGENCGRVSIIFLTILASLGPCILVVGYGYSWWLLLSCSVLLLPMFCMRIILFEPISARFNLMLRALGQAMYLFGIVASLGIIYGAPF